MTWCLIKHRIRLTSVVLIQTQGQLHLYFPFKFLTLLYFKLLHFKTRRGAGLAQWYYGLDNRGFESRQGLEFFSSPSHPDRHCSPPSLRLTDAGGVSFPEGKAAGAWSWPLTWIYCRGQESIDLYLHSPNTPSWRGAQLKKKARLKTEDIDKENYVRIVRSICFWNLDRKCLPWHTKVRKIVNKAESREGSSTIWSSVLCLPYSICSHGSKFWCKAFPRTKHMSISRPHNYKTWEREREREIANPKG